VRAILLLIILSSQCALLVRANEYDDRETIRRYAQKIDDDDAQQTQAAKERADNADLKTYNQEHSSTGGFGIIVFFIAVGVCYFFISTKRRN
jgi:hypothetical protein